MLKAIEARLAALCIVMVVLLGTLRHALRRSIVFASDAMIVPLERYPDGTRQRQPSYDEDAVAVGDLDVALCLSAVL